MRSPARVFSSWILAQARLIITTKTGKENDLAAAAAATAKTPPKAADGDGNVVREQQRKVARKVNAGGVAGAVAEAEEDWQDF